MPDSGAFYKDPQAILDYTVDWATWLHGSDTLATVTWTVPTGLTKTNQHNSSTAATVWLSGGVAGTAYEVTVHIVTAAGRQDDRTLHIHVEQR